MSGSSRARLYWFPAKRYGWGWGAPSRWEGWVCLAAFFIALGAGGLLFPPGEQPTAFGAVCAIATAALVGICWWKGEPPSWRWGSG